MFTEAITTLGSGEGGTVLLRLLGRSHPAVVHFPIALVSVAAALELWQLVRRRPGLAGATPICLIVGALSAGVASVFGWLLESFEGSSGNVVALHKWIGIASAVTAIVAAILLWKVATSPRALLALRLFLLTAAGLVGATGYLGGELVFGRNHLFRGILDEAPALAADTRSTTVPADGDHEDFAEDRIDFANDIAPILKGSCLRCHGGEKVKGKLDLSTRSAVMNGGRSGASLVPGRPAQSLLYVLLVDPDLGAKMPPSGEHPLSEVQIDTIHKWIEQGADWPEGIELR